MDSEKRFQIVNEMSVLKALQASDHVLKWVGAANLASGSGLSSSRCEEFLLLTELCVGSLYDYLSERPMAYPPETVARVFYQTLQAVSFMHSMNPPLAHRDLKIENLLIDGQGTIKLCDFGSTSNQTFVPDETWNMSRRNDMETELARFTTPMYRAPEMVDVWSNYPVNCAVDVWALGCLLYQLCFHHHPFEDGAKLRIINAKYVIPETDSTYVMFHDLIRQVSASAAMK
jgi:cyclin G-associated kinase